MNNKASINSITPHWSNLFLLLYSPFLYTLAFFCLFCNNQVYSILASLYLIFFCQKRFTWRYMNSLLILLQIFIQILCPQFCFHGDIILNMTNLTLQIISNSLSRHNFFLNPLYNLACCKLFIFLFFIVSLLVLESKFHEGSYIHLYSLMSLVPRTMPSTK